jgi:VanZ family protein
MTRSPADCSPASEGAVCEPGSLPAGRWADMDRSNLARRAFAAIALAAWIAVAVLSLVPGHDRPHTGIPGDLEHALAYAFTALATSIGWPRARGLGVVLALTIMSGAFEVCQFWIPGRGSSALTWIISSLSAGLGARLAPTVLRLAGSVRMHRGLKVDRQPTGQ